MRIIIKNFEKFNPRKDIKKHFWFRLQNTWIQDMDFFYFDSDEKMVWIYFLSQCSIEQNDFFELDLEKITYLLKISPEKIHSAINKLEEKKMVTLRGRTDEHHLPLEKRCAQYSTVQNNTEYMNIRATQIQIPENSKSKTPKPKVSIPYLEIGELWNKICGEEFSTIRDPSNLTPGRKKKIKSRWLENPDLTFWEGLFTKLATETDFSWSDTTTKSKPWRPDFNWIIVNPENQEKILEGKWAKKQTQLTDFTGDLLQ